MTSTRPGTVAVLVVPNGTHRPEPLAAAISAHHPAWDVVALWAGDPHLRPILADGLAWYDEAGELDPTWQRTLASLDPHDAEWMRLLDVARAILVEGATSIVALWVGAVAVLGPIDALLGVGTPAVVIARTVGSLPDDGLAPTADDLIAAGCASTNAIGLSGSSSQLIGWLQRRLVSSESHRGIARLIDHATHEFALERCTDPAIGVGTWRWETDQPRLLDMPGFDVDQPWVLDPMSSETARVDVVGHPARSAAVAAAGPQLDGHRRPLTLPGGVQIDAVIRGLVAASDSGTDGSPAPAPWTAAHVFRTWLESRYWSALHASRRDLAVAFADPRAADFDRYRDWCRRAFIDDATPLVIGAPAVQIDRWPVADHLAASGINLVGYLTRESGLGDVARRIRSGLEQAGVAVSSLAYHRTASPAIADVAPTSARISHATTLAVVTADQFPVLQTDHPELFASGTYTIGYWFWELEYVPDSMRAATALVNEIWVGSKFVADAFAAAVDTPVRCVPIPVPEP